MSVRHYLAANKILPIGEFNSSIKNKTNIDNHSYKSLEEAAGIWVQKFEPQPHNIEILKHFKNSNIYTVSPNWGKFFIYPALKEKFEDSYYANRKCILELFNYIRENICDGEEFEIYSCWTGEESNQDNKLYEVIDLKHFNLGDEFSLDENKYILIKG